MKSRFFLVPLLLLAVGRPARADHCTRPRLLIVLDKSSSMNGLASDEDQPPPGTPTKWEAAVQAIQAVTQRHQGEIDMGLMVFPYPDHCSPGQVLVDTDQNTSAAIVAALGDPPPSGGNYTPMAESLDAAASYQPLLDEDVPAYVLLITDGWQWCDPYDPSTRFAPVDAVERLTALGITTYVVGFGGGVDVLTLNRMAQTSGTALAGCDPTTEDPTGNVCYYQASDVNELRSVLDTVASHVIIAPEVCDRIDNDCDGLTDEDLVRTCSSACGTGQQVCTDGEWSECDAPLPSEEVCDGVDNDCNGLTDDGLTRSCQSACGTGQETCQNGEWVGCDAPQPETEVCDGQDNDCNGLVDDGDDLCGDGMKCEDGECVPVEVEVDASVPEDATGPGAAADAPEGCGCRSTSGSTGLPLLAAFFLLGLLWRRRRS